MPMAKNLGHRHGHGHDYWAQAPALALALVPGIVNGNFIIIKLLY